MFGTESQIDASFYRMIHELAGVPEPGTPADRRDFARQAFSADHRIAPSRGGQFPEPSAFFQVRCNDLTRNGFSFFLPSRPDFTGLVAAFGAPPNEIFVEAQVVRCQDVVVHPLGLVEPADSRRQRVPSRGVASEGAVPMVLVGCRFTRRLQRGAT